MANNNELDGMDICDAVECVKVKTENSVLEDLKCSDEGASMEDLLPDVTFLKFECVKEDVKPSLNVDHLVTASDCKKTSEKLSREIKDLTLGITADKLESLLDEDKSDQFSTKLTEVLDPDESVFDADRTLSLFNQSSLGLSSCGFNQQSSRIDRLLMSCTTPESVIDNCDPEVIVTTFKTISCKPAFLTWTLYMLSVTENAKNRQRFYKILSELLRSEGCVWTPGVEHLLVILLNYGCTCESLFIQSRKWPDEIWNSDTRDELLKWSHDHTSNQQLADLNHSTVRKSRKFPADNFVDVLNVYTIAISKRCSGYSLVTLRLMTQILLRIVVDKRCRKSSIMVALSNCLSAILSAVPSDDWNDWVNSFRKIAEDLSCNHVSMVHIVDCVPVINSRGLHVRRALVSQFSKTLFKSQFPSIDMSAFSQSTSALDEYTRLLSVLNEENIVSTDCSVAWSVVNMIDSCLSLQLLVHKEDFQMMINQLDIMHKRVPVSRTNLSQSLFKESCQLIVAKWRKMLNASCERNIISGAELCSEAEVRMLDISDDSLSDDPSD